MMAVIVVYIEAVMNNDKWEEKFRQHLDGMNRSQLTAIVDHCFKMCNTDNKREERDIWKRKAKIAIKVRDFYEQ